MAAENREITQLQQALKNIVISPHGSTWRLEAKDTVHAACEMLGDLNPDAETFGSDINTIVAGTLARLQYVQVWPRMSYEKNEDGSYRYSATDKTNKCLQLSTFTGNTDSKGMLLSIEALNGLNLVCKITVAKGKELTNDGVIRCSGDAILKGQLPLDEGIVRALALGIQSEALGARISNIMTHIDHGHPTTLREDYEAALKAQKVMRMTSSLKKIDTIINRMEKRLSTRSQQSLQQEARHVALFRSPYSESDILSAAMKLKRYLQGDKEVSFLRSEIYAVQRTDLCSIINDNEIYSFDLPKRVADKNVSASPRV